MICLGRDEATLEDVVVYQHLYGDYDVWVRKQSVFLEEVTDKVLALPICVPYRGGSRKNPRQQANYVINYVIPPNEKRRLKMPFLLYKTLLS